MLHWHISLAFWAKQYEYLKPAFGKIHFDLRVYLYERWLTRNSTRIAAHSADTACHCMGITWRRFHNSLTLKVQDFSIHRGINEGWKQETITPHKVELLRMIEPASPLYIISKTGVNKNGQRMKKGPELHPRANWRVWANVFSPSRLCRFQRGRLYC